MKTIQLKNGGEALVDDEDYGYLLQWEWKLHSAGYAVRYEWRNRKVVAILMHRALLNPLNGVEVDHINRDRLDNRRSNLRLCNRRQNVVNQRRTRQTKTSRYHGVGFDRESGKWRAQIKLVEKKLTIGRYATEIEAAVAYDEAAKKYYGEFASLNFT